MRMITASGCDKDLETLSDLCQLGILYRARAEGATEAPILSSVTSIATPQPRKKEVMQDLQDVEEEDGVEEVDKAEGVCFYADEDDSF
mgnify:CR=1 FL=1